MECELCRDGEANPLITLHLKQPDGRLNTIACLKCARESSAYCKKHERPHMGFLDGSTACLPCIEEEVKRQDYKKRVYLLLLSQRLPKDEFCRLSDWASDVSEITQDTSETCVLRALATRALRTKKSVEQVIQEVINEHSVNSILPFSY